MQSCSSENSIVPEIGLYSFEISRDDVRPPLGFGSTGSRSTRSPTPENSTLLCLLLSVDERRRRTVALARKRTVRTKMTLEPEFWRADSATDMTARTGCWSTCDRVSTSAMCFCLLVVVDSESRQTLLAHILPRFSVRCQVLSTS